MTFPRNRTASPKYKPHSLAVDLIAPCGMNCAVCSRYLSHKNHLKKSHCIGCRPGNKECAYLFKKCTGINKTKTKADAVFCFECSQYPCKQIHRMDSRYRKNYSMSTKDNLEFIKNHGTHKFVKDQHRRYRCSKCSGFISVHNRRCFQCDPVKKLVEKQS